MATVSVLDEREVVRERTVSVYDFRRPATLAREHSRVLELAFETYARQWGTQLTAKVRVKSVVRLEDVSMLSYDEYAASLPAVTAMVLCTVEGHDSKLVVQFPAPAALGWVNRMLGASNDAPMPDRKFTQIEQALVKGLMDEALEDLGYSLGPLLSETVRVDTIQYNSQFAQAAAPSELMIVAAFTMNVGDMSAPATLAVPAEHPAGPAQEGQPDRQPRGRRSTRHRPAGTGSGGTFRPAFDVVRHPQPGPGPRRGRRPDPAAPGKPAV